MKPWCLLLILSCVLHAQDMVVIVNGQNGVAALSDRDLKNIYLGKKSQWQDGSAIHPVILQEEALHENFLKTFLKRSPTQFDSYWKRMIFTGQGTPPTGMAEQTAVLAFVARTPGAIGYVPKRAAEAPGVKIVLIE